MIAGVFEEAKNVKDLSTLLREGKMKEFYQVANKVLRIKRNHPVVSRVKRDNKTETLKSSKTVHRLSKSYLSTLQRYTRDRIICRPMLTW